MFSKPGLTLIKALTSVAICVSSSAAVAASGQAVRPAASVPVAAVSSTMIAAAAANPCVAGAQGCVLPIGDTAAPVATPTTTTAPTYIEPAAGGGASLLTYLIPLVAAGAFLLLDPFDLFGEECAESPDGTEICDSDDDDA